MKVMALRTVYSRSAGKEYQNGQIFEVTDREARALLKLRKVEAVEHAPVAPAPKTPRHPPPTPRPIATTAIKVEDTAGNEPGTEFPRRYRRRDLLPEE